MSDDFGTINLRRGERTRELEVLRQHYRQHREALARLIADAPTEHLATEYQRLITEIDRALGKLDELEGAAAATPPSMPPPPPPAIPAPPRVPPPAERALAEGPRHEIPPVAEERRAQIAFIILAALLALGVIAGLVWWASRDGGAADDTIVADTSGTTAPDTVAETTETAPAASGPLAVTPASHDYGEIRKGTRAVREFEITNNTDEPITISIARSACRCLYYAHAPVVPPRAKESISVTVDGARAKAGALREALKISAKSDPSVATSVDVIATVR
jgi:hypothetical protein